MDHLELAKTTFNKTWEYLDRNDRTPTDDREMAAMALASRYHWRQVGDPKNHSISDWQVSRVFAVLGDSPMALSFGEASLEAAIEAELAPFYVAFGHEAVARAAALAGDNEQRVAHLAEARQRTQDVEDAEERKMLTDDLDTIG
jgi:hypothetical protein